MEPTEDKVFITDIRAGQEVVSPFLLSELRLATTKGGKPYVALKLKDSSGELEGRVWDGAEKFMEIFHVGDVARIRGIADSFQNQVQVKVVQARLVPAEEIDPSHFLPACPWDREEMFAELTGVVQSLSDDHIRGLLEDILTDPEWSDHFKRAPAAKRFHHAYLGGLLEHTLSVVRAAQAIAGLYPRLNRDLLIAGAVLHDLGKTREFDLGLTGDYTDVGRLLGHLVIGVSMIEEKMATRPDFPEETALLLKHLIVSHHGEYELGSPKKPKILEAIVLHALDDLDAKMNAVSGFIDRHADEKTGWTDFNRLMARFFYRPELPVFEADPVPGAEDDRPSGEPDPAGPAPVMPEEARPPEPPSGSGAPAESAPERKSSRSDPGQLSLLSE